MKIGREGFYVWVEPGFHHLGGETRSVCTYIIDFRNLRIWHNPMDKFIPIRRVV